MGAAALQLKKLFQTLLRIQPGEGPKTALMFFTMLSVVGSFIVGRVARDTLFLSRYSVTYLPVIYIWVAIGVSLQSYLYSRIADRFRRDHIFTATAIAVTLLYLASRALVTSAGPWFFPVLYVMVELVGSLTIIQAWTIANEVFNTREAKRLFGLVGAGGVAASVVVGFAIRGTVARIGTEDLLLVSAFLSLSGLACIHRLSRICREELVGSPAALRSGFRDRITLLGDFKRILSNRQLLLVSGMVALLALVMTFVDYLFKVSASTAFAGHEDQMSGFFGLFFGLTGVLSLFIQFVATSRLLERFGVLVSLLMLPGTLLIGAISFLAAPALWTASLLKGGDAVLRYTVNDATMQLLYLPIPSRIRGRAKAFVEGIIRPICIGLAGASLAWIFPFLPGSSLAWALLFTLAGWIGLTFGVRSQYVSSLFSTLRSRRLSLEDGRSVLADGAAERILSEALADQEENQVLHALEMIQFMPKIDWSDRLSRLCGHASGVVRRQAVLLLGQSGAPLASKVVHERLDDPDPSVAAAAIESYCAIGHERAVPAVSRFLEHAELSVRSATLVGLIRYGGLDGILNAAEHLKSMLTSSSPEERASGAAVLGKIGVKNFYHPLIDLMSDTDLTVRLQAIGAAALIRSQELLPAVLYQIERKETRSAAIQALAAFGPAANRILEKVLANPGEPLTVRLAIPEILARIGDPQAMQLLIQHVDSPETALRGQVLEGLHRIRLRKPFLRVPENRIRTTLLLEISGLYADWFSQFDLDLDPTNLLSAALADRQSATVKRIFRLLGCLFPVRTVDAIHQNLSGPARTRSNALEILDNLLDKQFKKLLLPFLDPAVGNRERLAMAQEFFNMQHKPRAAWLRDLIGSETRWLVICALYEAGLGRHAELVDRVQECTGSQDALVRETALDALKKLVSAREMQQIARDHLDDPVQSVRDYAHWLVLRADNA